MDPFSSVRPRSKESESWNKNASKTRSADVWKRLSCARKQSRRLSVGGRNCAGLKRLADKKNYSANRNYERKVFVRRRNFVSVRRSSVARRLAYASSKRLSN